MTLFSTRQISQLPTRFSFSQLQELTTNHWFVYRGRVRTKTVKRASRVVIEKYYPRLTLDLYVFSLYLSILLLDPTHQEMSHSHTNKKICDEVAIIPSKRLRNKIAGFTTHLMKRIQKGPVRGISFKLQEEERERKDNYGTSSMAR